MGGKSRKTGGVSRKLISQLQNKRAKGGLNKTNKGKEKKDEGTRTIFDTITDPESDT